MVQTKEKLNEKKKLPEEELESLLLEEYKPYLTSHKSAGVKNYGALGDEKVDILSKAYHSITTQEAMEDAQDLKDDHEILLHKKFKSYVKNELKGKKNLSHLPQEKWKVEAEKFANHIMKTVIKHAHRMDGMAENEAEKKAEEELKNDRDRDRWEKEIFEQWRGKNGFIKDFIEKAKDPNYSLRNKEYTSKIYKNISESMNPQYLRINKLGEELNSPYRNQETLDHAADLLKPYKLKFNTNVQGTSALGAVNLKRRNKAEFHNYIKVHKDKFKDLDKGYLEELEDRLNNNNNNNEELDKAA